MLASSSSSPTNSGHSPSLRARASLRSPRALPNPSRPNISNPTPTTSVKTADTKSAPVAVTADAGTQYTPPDWPPTDVRSSQYRETGVQKATNTTDAPSPASLATGDGAGDVQAKTPSKRPKSPSPQPSTPAKRSPHLHPPPEPQIRITPESSIAANAPLRRSDDEPTNAKRPRPDSSSKSRKVLPSDYTECEPKLLAGLIATMLMRLIHHNDTIPLKDGQLTRFHSRAPPGISVPDYMARLTFHATLPPPILLSMVFFIDRLSGCFKEFIINSLTVHRFLITAATVASKGLSDSFWTNSTYARVGGVSVKELALLEMELLMKCDWKIVPSPERLVEYYKGLVEGSDEYVLEGQEQDNVVMAESEHNGQQVAADDDDDMDTSDSSA